MARYYRRFYGASAGIADPTEPTVTHRAPPWHEVEGVTFYFSVGALPVGAASGTRKRAAEQHLAALPQCATWIWSDGSAEGGVQDGGAGALVIRPGGEEHLIRAPAGRLCSSFRAEMVALDAALRWLVENADDKDPVVG